MSRLAWAAAALGATAFLAALAFTGGRGGPGLEPFKPKGLMTIPVEEVREVDVTAPRGHWHFVRTPERLARDAGNSHAAGLRRGSTARSSCCETRGRIAS